METIGGLNSDIGQRKKTSREKWTDSFELFTPISVSTSNVSLSEDCESDNEQDSVIKHDGYTSEPDDVKSSSDSS